MRLASLRHGRDGRLAVVGADLAAACDAAGAAPTLQAALDDWGRAEKELRAIAAALDEGRRSDAFAFDPAACAAPLPRAYQWCDGSAYLNHMELMRRARGAAMPESFRTDPLMYQGGSDALLAARDDIALADEAWGIDFEAEVAVIVDDVPMGIAPAAAGAHIKLVTILNDVSLRNLIPAEVAKGFGFFHAKPATAFAPTAATPDALGGLWDGGKLHADMIVERNGERIGDPDAGADMAFDFPILIAHAAKSRHLRAGTIVGGGTVSNRDRARGSACLAELRTIETLDRGEPATPFLRFGDRLRIDLRDADGRSLFGAIEQTVVKYTPP